MTDVVSHGAPIVETGSAAPSAPSGPSGLSSAPAVPEQLRVLIVAGMPIGVVVVGIGSRLAMMLLRVTSDRSVHGAISDDGFLIGRFTVAGTYNLLQIGAVAGIIGAGVHLLVSPWLLGPMWFRRFVEVVAAGSVGGSMLIHADGVDFTILGPLWLAIALFVSLPAALAMGVSVGVDAQRRRAPQRTRVRRWALPVLLVACFPPVALVAAFAGALLAIGAAVRSIGPVRRLRASLGYAWAVRVVWMTVATSGLVSLVRDIGALV